jgi:hypothetical protein
MSGELHEEVTRFLDGYRSAFNRLDGNAIAEYYATPSGLLSGTTYVHWPDKSSVAKNMMALCEQYRRRGYLSAAYEAFDLVRLGAAAVFVDVGWKIECLDEQEPWRFHTAYNLIRAPEGLRALLCIAYEEVRDS